MSSGENAAEQTKGFVKGIGDVTEGLRKNINSFADDMIGSKSGTHSNAADGAHATTGTTGTTTTGTTGTTGSSGFSNDAKLAGQEVRESVNQAAGNTHTGTHTNTRTGI